ncbi:acyl carrier protein [Aliikangiella sp. IMCC44653]
MSLVRLKSIFIDSLGIGEAVFSEELEYGTIPQWDSVAHMGLVAAIEDEFDIMLDTDDIIDMSSVAKVKEILGKYDVKF